MSVSALKKMTKFWIFFFVGGKPLEGSLMAFVGWEVVWNGQWWCIKGFCIDFGPFEDILFWPFSFPSHMHGDLEVSGWKHLAGFFPVPELDLKLRERLRLVVLGLIVAKSYPDLIHSSLGHIFEPLMCWQGGPPWRKSQNFGFFLKLPRLVEFGLTFATDVGLRV